RPTTRRLHVLAHALVVSDGAGEGRAGVASVRGLLARLCERPQFVYRVAPVKPKHAVARSLAGQVLLRADPARVNVDCPGPVREDVPSDGFLSEGLTGENDGFERGL